MKIEKKKVKDSTIVSFAKKSAIATVLGMAAVFSLNACDDSSSASDNNSNQTTGPESSDATAPASSADEATPASNESVSDAASQENAPASSSQEQASETSSQQQSQASSSSKVIDIPLSHEPISSSVMDALSAAAESSSSATTPTSSSSSDVKFGDTPNNDTICPPPFPSSDPCKCVPDGTTVEYQTEFGVQLITCPLPASSQSSGFSFSMVTTFEKTDIEV